MKKYCEHTFCFVQPDTAAYLLFHWREGEFCKILAVVSDSKNGVG